MRLRATSILSLSAFFALIGCGGTATMGPDTNAGGSGDTASVSGGASTGGIASFGGAANGGSPSLGGNLGTGGVILAGGAPPNAGGKAATGGAPTASGGTPTATGGRINGTGGTPVVATGGAPASACVDTPRPNETCADAKTWGFCASSSTWFAGFCQVTCGTCGTTGTGGAPGAGGGISTGGMGVATGGRIGAGGTLGSGGNAPTGGSKAATGGTPPTGGSKATGGNASSGSCSWTTSSTTVSGSTGHGTRYWDCCMPSCSWSTQVPYCDANGTTQHSGTSSGTKSGCESGGNAFECFNFAPWYDAATNTSYGFAAFNGAPCGSCYALKFTGEGEYGPTPGSTSLKDKVMIVQVINIGGIGSGQFDLLIPGGGVGDFALGCQTQLSGANLGAVRGGMLTTCNQDVNCTRNMCNAAFASRPDLLAGCLWFTDCFQGADNPRFTYSKVTCPSQITSKSKISG